MHAQLDNAPCGLLVFDDDGQVLETNATLVQWLGWPEGELEGTPIESLYAPGGAIYHQTHLLPLLKLRGEVREIYVSLRTTSGEILPVLANASRREDGGRARSTCVFLPMRQRHRFEQQLIDAREAAEAARDAKARFLSMMAHEIRTPLSAISGLAHVLLEEFHGPLAHAQREDAQLIHGAANDIDRLVGEILRFSRAEAGLDPPRLEPVAIDDALAGAESLMRPRWAEAGLTYERRCPPSSREVIADPVRLHQILLNLLANATNHTDAGGAVAIECTVDAEAGMARMEVHDTGCGIPETDLGRIFEPFAQVNRAARPAGNRGTGLGLSISREFAIAMHGSLDARSEQGKGSVFTLTLPLST